MRVSSSTACITPRNDKSQKETGGFRRGSMLRKSTSIASIAAGALFALACVPAVAQVAGEVEFSRGVGFAQTAGQTPRTLGKGLELREGDRLTTSDGASAIVKLQDGTRM